MTTKNLDVFADASELVNLSKQMGEEYRMIRSQITILESEIIPSIKKSWVGTARNSFIGELEYDLNILSAYHESMGSVIAALMVVGNHYNSTEDNVLQHVVSIK